jgi:pimeloyl-ACP methyl ester carboxylesterase
MPHIHRAGVKVYYESLGRGTPLVFLHPIATNHYAWAHQLFAFAPSHRVIVMDHRGHGLSDKPATGYGIPEMAADLVAILDDAGIEKAVLVGNSIGGMIAMQANLDAPDRVLANLILSSGTNLAASRPPGSRPPSFDNFEAAMDGMFGGAISERTRRERPEVWSFFQGVSRVEENFSRAVFLACAQDPGGVFHWNITARLGDIRAPTLVIAGDEDRTLPAEMTRRLADGIPGARFKLVPEVGHFYQLERPADFNADLRAFLQQIGV